MKFVLYITFILYSFVGVAQSIEGVISDRTSTSIPGVLVQNLTKHQFARASNSGHFVIQASRNDSLQFTFEGFDTLHLVVQKKHFGKQLNLQLKTSVQEVVQANVVRSYLKDFDVGFLPPVKGVQIYTGTNAVIDLSKLSGAKSSANPREMFAKVPGLNIWESDGAGIQIGIGGRGLSPNRTANFNTRQNGYDISADALGYPESYYTPPFEALQSIEIIRGSASLQFGTQFGGLLNFIIKDAVVDSPLEFTTRNTVGAYGYLATFNRISGSKKRFFYQAYHQYKRGNGFRENSHFFQHQAFAQLGYHFNENIKVRLEYTHMNYLTKQAGGLTDFLYEDDHRQSVRDRNWFSVNWNLLALHYDHKIGKRSYLNVRAFGLKSNRKTLGFLGKVTQLDPGGLRDMLNGDFKNGGVEARFLTKYALQKDTSKTAIQGAFLLGGRYYQGRTQAEQGLATDGVDADFTYQNPSDLESSSFSYPSENAAFFAENILFIGKRWTANLGVRFEYIKSSSSGYYKQYVIHPLNMDTLNIFTLRDSNTVQRAVPLFGFGSSFKTGKRTKLYTNFTQNYRAINFTDIRINNPNVVVDSLIKDEFGYTAELGFRGLVDDYWIYDIAAFYLFYGDKIGLAPKPGTILKERTNIGNARNLGIELFSEFNFIKALKDSSNHSLSLFVNAAYIHAQYIDSKEPNFIGKQVEYVSPLIIKSGIKYSFKQFSCQVQGSYNSSQFSDASNSVIPSGDAVIGQIPAYMVFDFSSRYTFKKGFQLEAGINNFTNEKYFTRRATGYPGPGILPSDGISAYLTVQYKFKLR